MAKFNEVSLSRKKELEQPDEVTENLRKLFDFMLKYKVQIGIGIGAFFILIVGIVTIRYFSQLSERHASYLLDQSMEKYSRMQTEKKPAEICDLMQTDLQKIINEHSGTVAANFAVLQLANVYYSAGRYDDAVAYYNKAMDVLAGQPLFVNLIQMGLGLSFEAKGENDKAAAYFEKIITDPGSLMKDQALFNAGRIYGKIGKADKRREVYEKIVSDYRDSLYAEIAGEYVSG